MLRYTEQDLKRYEGLVADARERVIRQQDRVERLTNLDDLESACARLDSLLETLILYEEQRVRILEALRK